MESCLNVIQKIIITVAKTFIPHLLGTLYNLITHHTKTFQDDIQLLSDIRFAYSAIRNIGFKFEHAIQKTNSPYYHTFKRIIEKRWFYQNTLRGVNYNLVQTNVYKEELSEALSDTCMSNIMGTQQTGKQKICQVTDECWTVMTKKGTEGYYLAHQALFFILADYTGNFLTCCKIEKSSMKYTFESKC